jgi:hypothetical protein
MWPIVVHGVKLSLGSGEGIDIEKARGAIWYLSKYFTPHPVGEPHFFVKPWALTRVPRGWSLDSLAEHDAALERLRALLELERR